MEIALVICGILGLAAAAGGFLWGWERGRRIRAEQNAVALDLAHDAKIAKIEAQKRTIHAYSKIIRDSNNVDARAALRELVLSETEGGDGDEGGVRPGSVSGRTPTLAKLSEGPGMLERLLRASSLRLDHKRLPLGEGGEDMPGKSEQGEER